MEQSKNFWKFLFLEIYIIKNVWKGGFQLILILGLLGMYFDAVVVKVKTFLLLFRLALAILCAWGILPFVLCFGNLQVDTWWVSFFATCYSFLIILIWLLFSSIWSLKWKMIKSFLVDYASSKSEPKILCLLPTQALHNKAKVRSNMKIITLRFYETFSKISIIYPLMLMKYFRDQRG